MPTGTYKRTLVMKTGKHMIGRKWSKQSIEKRTITRRKKSSSIAKKQVESAKKYWANPANKEIRDKWISKFTFSGKKHSEEDKKKMREGLERRFPNGRAGVNSPTWQGGIAYLSYTVDWTDTLKRAIRERDHYTCQICGDEPSICVHHIDYNKKNCDQNNLIILCRKCHPKTNYNKEKWLVFLRSIIQQKNEETIRR